MAGTELIRSTIRSTEKTQKITRAMNLVATSKLAKTQRNMKKSKPYAERIREVVGHIANSQTEYRHPYLQHKPEIKSVCVIVVASDRGLCGGLNSQLFKALTHKIMDWQKNDIKVNFCLFGSKAIQFFGRHGGKVLAQAHHLGDEPSAADVIGVVKVALDAFADGQVDEIHLAASEFENVMVQRPVVRRLVPIEKYDIPNQPKHWDYLYEPDAKGVIDMLFNRFMENQIYHAVIEHVACEQAARMVAMKSATDNANKIIDELRLVYNKARQAAITCELAEIVSGAAAIDQ